MLITKKKGRPETEVNIPLVEDLVYNKKISQRKVARFLGVNYATLSRRLKDAQQEKRTQKRLENRKPFSHEDVVDLYLEYATKKGWRELPTSLIKSLQLGTFPDILLSRHDQGKPMIQAIEVKSEKAGRDEIRRGLGQCAYYKVHGYSPVLVVFKTYREELRPIAKLLDWVTVILYDEMGWLHDINWRPLTLRPPILPEGSSVGTT